MEARLKLCPVNAVPNKIDKGALKDIDIRRQCARLRGNPSGTQKVETISDWKSVITASLVILF